MARKALRKQRAWIKMCRENTKAGLINTPEGGWVRESRGGKSTDVYAGYNFDKKKRRGPKKGSSAPAEVE